MICRICDSDRLEPVLDLGEQPWCNHFLRPEEVGNEPFYPLRSSIATSAQPRGLITRSRRKSCSGTTRTFRA